MMGRPYLTLILLMICNLSTALHAQHVYNKRVIYKMRFQTDSNEIATKNTMDMELLINDDFSLFQLLKQRHADSVLYFHERNVANQLSFGSGILLKPVNKFAYKIIKNSSVIRVYDSAFGRNMQGKDIMYTYDEPIDIFRWQIKEDTIHFAGSVCQRADLFYGGRNWIAWFALDIPISDGPYKFAGLPGLIVKISDNKGYWDFELSAFETISIQHAFNFQKWFIIERKSKEKLYRDRLSFQRNMPIWAADSKPDDPADLERVKDDLRQLEKDLKNDNNWIERYP